MREKLTLLEGFNRINAIVNQPLENLLNENQFDMIIKNKGKAGTLLEELINLEPVSHTMDFVDGELKTNFVNENGIAKEPLAITQVGGWIKDIIEGLSFEDSKVFKKIKKFLYVPLVRLPKNEYKKWKFLPPILFDKDNREQQTIYNCLCDDYKDIQKQAVCCFKQKLKFHTFNGDWNYLQIRTKDSMPYTPIILDGFEFSNKQRAFYIKANFFKKLNESKIGVS